MPQFYAEHVPARITCDFTRGYMECAEWLWPEPDSYESYPGAAIHRDKVRGWSADAVKRMQRDCKAFMRENAAALATYCEVTGRDMASAGHDFFLTREGHGTGFWDRGDHEVLTRLTAASEGYGEAGYPWMSRGWVRLD